MGNTVIDSFLIDGNPTGCLSLQRLEEAITPRIVAASQQYKL